MIKTDLTNIDKSLTTAKKEPTDIAKKEPADILTDNNSLLKKE